MIGGIFNRLRGTGGINGTAFYALYVSIIYYFLTPNIELIRGSIGIPFTYLSYDYVFYKDWLVVPLSFAAFFLGEGTGWGKWVGYVCHHRDAKKLRKDDGGQEFPYIHQISNFFFNQFLYPLKYCYLALFIRGMIFFLPEIIVAYSFGLLNMYESIFFTIFLGIGFPISCILGTNWKFSFRFWKFHLSPGWENQEYIYGAIFHNAFFVYLVVKNYDLLNYILIR